VIFSKTMWSFSIRLCSVKK